jgi:hypothetical protein
MIEWSEAGAEHTCLVQHLQCALIAGDVQLVPRAALERTATVGANLRRDAEAPQKSERASRHRGTGDIEMDRDLAAAL